MIYTLGVRITRFGLTIWLATLALWAGMPAFYTRAQQDSQPPQVFIENPQEGEVIFRRANAAGIFPVAYEPDRYTVEGSVVWPDGSLHTIDVVQLWVDGAQVGEVFGPAEDRFQLVWELDGYGLEEGEPVRLQVLVRDAAGFENTSAPVNVVVWLDPVEAGEVSDALVDECVSGKALADWWCMASNAVGGSGQLLRMIAVLLLAAGLLWRVRQRKQQMVSEKPVAAPERSRETITRITTPLSADIAGHLEVLQGDIDMLGKRIALYMDAKTLAGRSLHEAEIVFNMNSSTSVVSRKHCEFIGRKGVMVVRDLGSTQGTYVNGERLPKGGDGRILKDGDRIELGPAEQGGVVLRFATSAETNSDNQLA